MWVRVCVYMCVSASVGTCVCGSCVVECVYASVGASVVVHACVNVRLLFTMCV